MVIFDFLFNNYNHRLSKFPLSLSSLNSVQMPWLFGVHLYAQYLHPQKSAMSK